MVLFFTIVKHFSGEQSSLCFTDSYKLPFLLCEDEKISKFMQRLHMKTSLIASTHTGHHWQHTDGLLNCVVFHSGRGPALPVTCRLRVMSSEPGAIQS